MFQNFDTKLLPWADTPSLVLPLKWEQPSTVKSVFQLISKTDTEWAFKQNGKMEKESKVAERQRERERVCASVDQNRW